MIYSTCINIFNANINMFQSADSFYNWNTLAKNITKTNFCYFVDINYVVMVALCLIA